MANEFLRTPIQAATTFSLSGAAAVRPKNLFYVRFERSGAAAAWKDIGFLAKSVDRPAVQAEVQELNQYNKRRKVHTQWKSGGMRIVFYDTADSMAQRMFLDYGRHYFGDFRREPSTNDYAWDITSNTFLDSGQGFGFAPPGGSTLDDDANFFLHAVHIYQVFGGEYIHIALINPRITSFDPDNFDYSDSDAALVVMSLEYDSILYRNNGQPLKISGDSALKESFDDIRLEGRVLDLDAETATVDRTGSQTSPTTRVDPLPPSVANPETIPQTSGLATGGVGLFGRFDFGGVGNPQRTVVPTLSTDLIYSALLSNPGLAGSLDVTLASRGQAETRLETSPLAKPAITQARYDAAKAALSALGSVNGMTHYGDRVMGALLAETTDVRDNSYANPPIWEAGSADAERIADLITELTELGIRPPVINYDTLNGQPAPNSWNSASKNGLALSAAAYGQTNRYQTPVSQIGINRSRLPTQPTNRLHALAQALTEQNRVLEETSGADYGAFGEDGGFSGRGHSGGIEDTSTVAPETTTVEADAF